MSVRDMNHVADLVDDVFEDFLSTTYPIIGWDADSTYPCYACETMPFETFFRYTESIDLMCGMFVDMICTLVRAIEQRFPPAEYPILGYRTPLGQRGEQDAEHIVLANRDYRAVWRGDYIMPPLRISRADLGTWEAHFSVFVYAKGYTSLDQLG